jgi:membrane-anchored glycerophosphoryl diester phosphodiesterase (GDPDase)
MRKQDLLTGVILIGAGFALCSIKTQIINFFSDPKTLCEFLVGVIIALLFVVYEFRKRLINYRHEKYVEIYRLEEQIRNLTYLNKSRKK